MKKYIFSLVLALGFFASSSVFANITPIPISPTYTGTSVNFKCSLSNSDIILYNPNGTQQNNWNCADYPNGFNYQDTYTMFPSETFHFVELTPFGFCGRPATYDLAILSTCFSSEIAYSWGLPIPPPPPNYGISITGGSAPSYNLGEQLTGESLIAGVAKSVQSGLGFNGLGSIIMLVAGLILCFSLILYVVDLYGKTDEKGLKKRKI